jgi:hypothetical protein
MTPRAGNAAGRACRLALLTGLLGLAGCGTTRVTNTQRSATEQLLVSNAIDQSVSQLDFRALADKPVYIDAQYLQGSVDHGYLVSCLRQHLLASGCVLKEDRSAATYVVEARSGAVGTDQNQVLLGVPQMNVPAVVPGQPSAIPEMPLAKRTDQRGVAKVAVFAYNRRTGRPVWQSGVVQSVSTSKDTWLLGAGPFRRGTIGEPTEVVGQRVSIPLLSGKEAGVEERAPVLPVTRPAAWEEETPAPPGPFPLIGKSAAAEKPAAQPAAPSVECPDAGAYGRGGGTPGASGGRAAPGPSAEGGSTPAKDSGATKAPSPAGGRAAQGVAQAGGRISSDVRPANGRDADSTSEHSAPP